MRRKLGRSTAVAAVLAILFTSVVVVGANPAVGNDSGDAGSLTAGNNFSCAVTSTGGVKCWGTNTHGQLGDGSTTLQTTPQTVPGLTDIAEVSAGWQHACALSTTGGVKCWGLNGSGQVGNGTTVTPQTTPVDVVGLTSGVQAISVGTFHNCALTDGGGVKCWGDNPAGALGDGTTTDSSSPVDVVGLDTGVDAIAAGDGVTCAVLDTGALECWGNNATGGVGDGTNTNRSTPTGVVGLSSGVASASAEGTYPSGSRSCAVTTGGAAKCWGTNSQGQLGDGSTIHRNTPVDVVGLGSGVEAITTGSSQTCALTTSGGAKCWGQWGVGVGDNELHLTPLDVDGLSSGVAELQAGGFHTCARTDSGAIKCWGGNNGGQLGLGFTDGQSGLTPQDVSGSFHRPECPTVVPEPHTGFTSTDGYAVGSILTFAAEPGFALDSPTALTCQADLTLDGTAPTASASSTITLDPPNAIRGGDEVDIELSGFAPDTDIGWCQAISDAPVGTGNCSSIHLATTDATGTHASTMRIDRFVYSAEHSRWVDCATETCLVGAAAVDALDETVVTIELDIVFDAPPSEPGTITLDPLRQTGGQSEVAVNGAGFRPDSVIEIFQCTTDPTTPADCEGVVETVTTDGSGGFVSDSFRVSASVEPLGGSIDLCFSPSGDCVIGAAEPQDFPGTIATAPLTDAGPVATVLPGSGAVVEGNSGETSLVVEVTLSNDWHEPIEVPWSTIFESSWDPVIRADPGVDYTPVSGTVVFAPFETTKTVSIPVVTDTASETDELVVVSFQRPSNAMIGGFWGLSFGVIRDDDLP